MPQVEVNFDIDANGIVSVQAKDKATGKEQQIRIQASGGLSKDDIEKMVKDAEAHAEEDKKRRELVEVRNQAEQLIHASEKTLNDAGDKAPADGKAAVEAAIADLKTVTTGEDVGQIRAKTETLAQAVMKIGEALYKAQPGEPQGPGAAGQAGPGAQEMCIRDSHHPDQEGPDLLDRGRQPDRGDHPRLPGLSLIHI